MFALIPCLCLWVSVVWHSCSMHGYCNVVFLILCSCVRLVRPVLRRVPSFLLLNFGVCWWKSWILSRADLNSTYEERGADRWTCWVSTLMKSAGSKKSWFDVGIVRLRSVVVVRVWIRRICEWVTSTLLCVLRDCKKNSLLSLCVRLI